MNRLSLNLISVKEPCTMPWNEMAGDETVRYCDKCRKNVYDLSALTRDAAEALINEREGKICVRYYARADGTVVTRDCTPAPAFPFTKIRALAACALTFVAFAAIAAAPGCQPAVGNLQRYDPPVMGEAPPVTTAPSTAPATKPAAPSSTQAAAPVEKECVPRELPPLVIGERGEAEDMEDILRFEMIVGMLR